MEEVDAFTAQARRLKARVTAAEDEAAAAAEDAQRERIAAMRLRAQLASLRVLPPALVLLYSLRLRQRIAQLKRRLHS